MFSPRSLFCRQHMLPKLKYKMKILFISVYGAESLKSINALVPGQLSDYMFTGS